MSSSLRSVTFARRLLAGRSVFAVRTFSSSKVNSISSNGAFKFENHQNKRNQNQDKFNPFIPAGALLLATGAAAVLAKEETKEVAVNDNYDGSKVDWKALRKDITAILDKPGYDDGSIGPILVRLAWHASGNFNQSLFKAGAKCPGGSWGGTMRFAPESLFGGNAGLHKARDFLEPLKKKYPEVSYADLYSFAGVVAVEEMNGPKIPWGYGRKDYPNGSYCPANGLPDGDKGPAHIREIFYRMGFNDQEIVALLGAHCLGRCHTDASGYDGPWTKSPTMFSNDFFRELLDEKWVKRDWKGPLQYRDDKNELMMLPADLALLEDPVFRKYVEKYSKDEQAFFADFASAFSKLLALGCTNLTPSKL